MKKIYFTFLVPIFLYSQNLEELVNLTIENRLVESSKQNLDALKDEYKSVQRGYLPKLDADAMVHDYECLIGANRNFIKWFKSAWKYLENMRKNGKGNQIFRFVLLCLAGFFFVPYCAIFTPKYYPIKK